MKNSLLLGALIFVTCALASCAAQTATFEEPTGTGTAQFALTGALPGVTHITLSIYDGAVSDTSSTSPTFQPIACAPYAGSGGNRVKLQYLKASSNYTLYVELFGDDKCQKRVGFGWRGNVEVSGGNDLADVIPTYYVQPYLFGQFTGLAPVPQTLKDSAKLLSCINDVDCKSAHANGSCGKDNKCVVDNLFPLDGGVRRGFANSATLADGSVAIFGGLTAPSDTNWAAVKSPAELFDPLLGYFRSINENAYTPVGLATAVTDGAGAVAIVGGSTDSGFTLDAGKTLKTTIDATGCPTLATCPVSKLVQRWDFATQTYAYVPLSGSLTALPIVSRVHAKTGDLLLIAGGEVVPISKAPGANDARQASATLCDLTQKGIITCAPSKNSMLAPRANAATACLSSAADGTCTKLLILGGRRKAGTPLAEAYDAETDAFVPVTIAPPIPTAPFLLHGGQLLKIGDGKFLLVGASNDANFIEEDVLTGTAKLQPPMIVAVTQGQSSLTMQMVPVPMGAFAGGDAGKRLFATAVTLRDGSSLLIGGLDSALQPVADALVFDANGQPVARAALASSRIGGTASLVGGKNALGGCVLLAGGFTTDAAGALTPQNHIEAFCPGP